MNTLWYPALFALCLAAACTPTGTQAPAESDYLTFAEPGEVKTGGIRMIPISTPLGEFRVWTKRVGNNPRMKLLLLHGGPGGTHEYFECFDSFLPKEGIEYYYYDQLGSYYSDQPADSSLWVTERFVEEVEQVRQALGLDSTNFYLLGHSWGGILAMEYALKYQDRLKGLIISNMMSSCPEYGKYADEVLARQLDPQVLTEMRAFEAAGDFGNPRYQDLLINNYYTAHVLRMPPEEWPDPVNRMFKHLNPQVYVLMQGPSEFGISGRLASWDRTADLSRIAVPTLVIGAEHDTMDPKFMEMMAGRVQRGRYLYCPNGSHCAMYDDQQTYVDGLVRFIKDVDAEQFN